MTPLLPLPLLLPRAERHAHDRPHPAPLISACGSVQLGGGVMIKEQAAASSSSDSRGGRESRWVDYEVALDVQPQGFPLCWGSAGKNGMGPMLCERRRRRRLLCLDASVGALLLGGATLCALCVPQHGMLGSNRPGLKAYLAAAESLAIRQEAGLPSSLVLPTACSSTHGANPPLLPSIPPRSCGRKHTQSPRSARRRAPAPLRGRRTPAARPSLRRPRRGRGGA